MKKSIKILTILFLVSLLIPSLSKGAEDFKIQRISGESRVETSIEISREVYETSKNVILIGYNGQPDALTGSLLAVVKDAPILFVDQKYVSLVKDRLVELKTEKVYILGGEDAFSKKLFNEFKLYKPTRIAGKDRYSTAVKIAQKSFSSSLNEVFLASGEGEYSDALSIGPFSARDIKPLLLASKRGLSKETLNYLKTNKVKKVDIIGGTSAVSKSTEDQLKNLNIKTTRIFGKTRELTAVAIAKKYGPDFLNIVVSNGWSSADASVSGYFAAKKNAVLLFSNKNKLDKATLDFIEINKKDIYLLGGVKVLEKNVKDKIELSLVTSQVSSEEEFKEALVDKGIKVIRLIDNISLEKRLVIDRPIVIEGNNKEIKSPPPDPDLGTTYNEDSIGVMVTGNNVSIRDLTIKDADFHNIYFLNVSGASVDNLTLKNSTRIGASIDSSEVEIKNIKTINNSSSGIVVIWDKVTYPQVTLSGKNTHQSPKGGIQPFIDVWGSHKDRGWVKAEGYKEFGAQRGEPSGFGDSYYYFDSKEYKDWMKGENPEDPYP